MQFLPNLCWENARGCYVTDLHGQEYLDFTSGVMITNVGHGHPKIIDAIINQLKKPLLTSYLFPTQIKNEFLEALCTIIPTDYRVALLNTGSEAIELSIKLARLWCKKNKPEAKGLIISYYNSFHGRTLGSQAAGGEEKLKTWLPEELTSIFKNVPYPDGFYNVDTTFEGFINYLHKNNINKQEIAALLIEPYQGATVAKAPQKYLQQLSK